MHAEQVVRFGEPLRRIRMRNQLGAGGSEVLVAIGVIEMPSVCRWPS